MDVKSTEKKSKTKASVDIGAILVKARKDKQLTSQNVAEQLNLTVGLIEKLENNQFEMEIPIAFVRGYIRAYAQLVGLDSDDLCHQFDRQSGGETGSLKNIKVVSSYQSSRREINSSNFLFKLVTYLIVISIIGFGGWEAWKRLAPAKMSTTTSFNEIPLNEESSDTPADINGDLLSEQDSLLSAESTENGISESPDKTLSQDNGSLNQDVDSLIEAQDAVDATENSAEEFVATDELNVTEQPLLEEGQAAVDPLVTENTPDTIALSQSDGNVSSAVDSVNNIAENIRLVSANFVFSDECWVKVVDATGEVLAVGTKQAGKVMPLQGSAPLTVTLGAPAAVALTYQGESYDLSQFSPSRVAVFVLD